MKLALDTNAYTDLARGFPAAIDVIRSAGAVFIPFIVIAELKAGFAGGTKTIQNEKVLTRFLAKPKTTVLFPDSDTIARYAEFCGSLESRSQQMICGLPRL
jgi:predicted nucleic acid-binding protein